MWVEETLEILTITDSTFFITVKLMNIATNYYISRYFVDQGPNNYRARSFFNSSVFLFERNNSKFVRFIYFGKERKKKKLIPTIGW